MITTDPSTTWGVPTLSATDPSLDPGMLDQLRSLEEGGEPGLLAGLVEVFAQDTRDSFAEINGALREGNREQAGRLAHRIKGGAGSLAACRMAELCGRLETRCREQDAFQDELVELFDRIRAEFDRALEALTREVESWSR